MPVGPNILLITDDQHRYDYYGHTGAAGPLRTPAFDRLAREGATLHNAYSNCPVCMPTRFTWYHGLYASQAAHGLMRNCHDWPTRFPTMPQGLQRAGYHTAVIGKVHAHGPLDYIDLTRHESQLLARGFDEAVEVSGKSLASWRECRWTRHLEARGLLNAYRSDLCRRNEQLGGQERYQPSILDTDDYIDGFIGNRAVQWLQRYHSDRPFFLHASFCAPHFPLDPPPEFFGRHAPEDMPPPVGVSDPARVLQWQRHRALHADMIALVDQQVGRLLDVLDQRGLAEDTVVVYGTDHGDMIGDHDLTHKGWAYDPSCRTPITVRWPGHIPQGRRLDTMAEAVDLPCTLLDFAGCTGPLDKWLPHTPGRSFRACLTGQSNHHRDWAYSECSLGRGWGRATDPAKIDDTKPDTQLWRMCCDPDWKYVLHDNGHDQLFDRRADPHEEHNLADHPDQADRVSAMRRRLIASMTCCVAPDSMPGARRRRSIRDTARTGEDAVQSTA